MRKVGAEPKANSNSRVERPRWANYKDFEEDVDDIGDNGFEDETIGYQEGFFQPRNRRNFRNRGHFGQRGKFCNRILRQSGKILFQSFKSGVYFLDEKWKREGTRNLTNIYTDISYHGKLKEPT